MEKSRARILALLFLFIARFVVVIYRLVFIQVISAQSFKDLAQTQYLNSYSFLAERGTIFDRDGNQLAVSTQEVTIFANPFFVKDPGSVAEELSAILDKDKEELKKKLTQPDTGFVFLARKVSPELAQRVQELDMDGVLFTKESKRFYPHAQLAAQTLGFVGVDNEGLSGLEFQYENVLHGKDGVVVAERDSHGGLIPGTYTTREHPVNGGDIYLTLDKNIQFFSDQKLKEVVEAYRAKRGTVIVIRPHSGEILAMSSYPTFDLNKFYDVSQDMMRNLATSLVYEPGSTFKSVIIAAALEEGLVGPRQYFHLPPTIKVADEVIKEPHRNQEIDYTVTQILAHSANVGAVLVARVLEDQQLYNYLRKFGLGERTGIDLPGEERGILPEVKNWSRSTKATISFGQGISVTPLQLLMAHTVFANGGILIRPYLVDRIVYPDGRISRPGEGKQGVRVVSEDTARQITVMLREAVKNGTGTRAEIAGYEVVGKTGTAQKVDSDGLGYDEDRSIVSFVGFAPASNPQAAIVVVIDEPSSSAGDVWGGTVSAPLFKEIMEFTLRHLRLPPKSEDL
ncbi:stage V sporulation protein D (sporulation-specific penicillin-binding protein) [Candidatus Hakubella thermalkaliphila]|uniref:Stage V sporulation protein D (Sporulation-specific penicillin-binding protein) n=1 Tax=Candidatus Hakubella thermalkaliphila TaxID=2754717 RepID=A0A6V8NSA6_9ACTN|nr:stage V sporulation protein D (sporulation-specific penicillin-binding protein) [Candidatus Hakubella thermalkaliphila]